MGKRPRGRPTVYTAEVADEIVRRMAGGESLNAICVKDSMPAESTVRLWAIEDREGFSARYAKAVQVRAMRWAEEVIEIADDSGFDARLDAQGNIVMDGEAVARARLRVDTRKWLLSKVLPKVYGDKVAVQHSGRIGGVLRAPHPMKADEWSAVAQRQQDALPARKSENGRNGNGNGKR